MSRQGDAGEGGGRGAGRLAGREQSSAKVADFGVQKPYPFKPDVVISVDQVFDQKLDAIHQLTSQAYEGGADGNEQRFASVPPAEDVAGRKAWLSKRWQARQG